MKCYTISTGSSGNCYVIEYSPQQYFLLDLGVNHQLLVKFFKTHDLMLNNIKFALVSHFHVDHLANHQTLNNYGIPVYLPHNQQVKNPHFQAIKPHLVNPIEHLVNQTFHPNNLTNISVMPFVVPHDSFNLGFKIQITNPETNQTKTIIYITDCGNTKTLPLFVDEFNNLDLLMMECNYDDYEISKTDNARNRRTKSDGGHCSNLECYQYLTRYLDLSNTIIYLVHRSLDNIKFPSQYEIFKNIKCKGWYVAPKPTILEF